MRSPEDKMQEVEADQTASLRPQATEMLQDLVKAFRQEIQMTNQRIYALECAINKYERAFDRMFTEELDSRVNSKRGGLATEGFDGGGLHRIEEQIRQQMAYAQEKK